MFKIKYQTKFGETLCVIGSIGQLGVWKSYKCHLKWTEGHIWVSERPLFVKMNQSIFQYKYALLWEKDLKLLKIERGVDRIADLKILPETLMNTNETYNKYLQDYVSREGIQYKQVEMNDVWEKFTVNFTVFYPM